MTAENTIRFLAHEARACRDRDSHEAFCLLLPAMIKLLDLPAMNDIEAAAFCQQFKKELRAHCEKRDARAA